MLYVSAVSITITMLRISCTYYIVPTIINALSMYVISLLCNTRLGVGTLIIATSSAINKKITLQSTSATNVASVAFAI